MTSAWTAFPLLDRLFDDVMTGASGTASRAASFSPPIDVFANEDAIVLVADVPGVKQEDLEITLDDGLLTIKGQRRYEGTGGDGKKEKVWLSRGYGSFSRSFTLPDTVDPEKLTAELVDGVLTVSVAHQPKTKPRKIAITPRAPQLGGEPKTET